MRRLRFPIFGIVIYLYSACRTLSIMSMCSCGTTIMYAILASSCSVGGNSQLSLEGLEAYSYKQGWRLGY